MSLLSLLKPAGPSGFGYGSTAEQVTAGLDLAGRRYLLTGCNSGLGAEVLRVLSLRGATVVGAARSLDKARAACGSASTTAVPVACELSEPDSVAACVAELKRGGEPLDGIICNAGIMALPKRTVKHGLELQFLTNHVGHFILVTGLLDLLADEGRVVVLSSAAHTAAPSEGIRFDDLSFESGYSSWRAYGQSKLANLLFARQLARRLGDGGQAANALHPGVIATNLARHMNPVMTAAFQLARPLVLKTVPQGAATETWAAVHPDAAGLNGEYLSDCNVAKSSKAGADMDLAERLWTETERIVAGLLPS